MTIMASVVSMRYCTIWLLWLVFYTFATPVTELVLYSSLQRRIEARAVSVLLDIQHKGKNKGRGYFMDVENDSIHVSVHIEGTSVDGPLRIDFRVNANDLVYVWIDDWGPEQTGKPISDAPTEDRYRLIFDMGTITYTQQDLIDLDTGRGLIHTAYATEPGYQSGVKDCASFVERLVSTLGGTYPPGYQSWIRMTTQLMKKLDWKFDDVSILYRRLTAIKDAPPEDMRLWSVAADPNNPVKVALVDDDSASEAGSRTTASEKDFAQSWTDEALLDKDMKAEIARLEDEIFELQMRDRMSPTSYYACGKAAGKRSLQRRGMLPCDPKLRGVKEYTFARGEGTTSLVPGNGKGVIGTAAEAALKLASKSSVIFVSVAARKVVWKAITMGISALLGPIGDIVGLLVDGLVELIIGLIKGSDLGEVAKPIEILQKQFFDHPKTTGKENCEKQGKQNSRQKLPLSTF